MTDIKLNQDERIDQLYSKDVKIIQSNHVFSFSLDAVLLADFVKVSKQKAKKALDLCSGNGAISLFISDKFPGEIDAVEIQDRLADMAKRSVKLNQLENKIHVYTEDLNQAPNFLKPDSYDIVTCNPPYFKSLPQSQKNPNPYLAIARHEIKVNLHQVIAISSKMLKMGGKFYLVHRPDRIDEIITEMKNLRLAPKRIQLIYPKKDADANMILVEAIKDGRPGGIKFLSPIITYDESQEYSIKVKEMLYGK